MNQKETNRSLNVLFVVIASSLMVLGMSMSINLVAAEVDNVHNHENTNKNNEHDSFGAVVNEGGKDGLHSNESCVENTNNDKGTICHDNFKDRE